MKSLLNFLFGIILSIVGVILFLLKVRVSSFTFFYRYNGTNVTALLLIVMCILVVAFVVYPNFITGIFLGIDFIGFIVSVIMSMNFYIIHMSALEIIVILLMICIGIGLTLSGIFHARDDERNDKNYKSM
ncbi:MAG: hypothetical protein ACI4D8_03255 [Wujia sp.]